jgi:hypothetical protein
VALGARLGRSDASPGATPINQAVLIYSFYQANCLSWGHEQAKSDDRISALHLNNQTSGRGARQVRSAITLTALEPAAPSIKRR